MNQDVVHNIIFLFLVIIIITFVIYECIRYILIHFFHKNLTPNVFETLFFKKSPHNPTLSPPLCSPWEENGTLNPAAYIDDSQNVHIIYRALGNDGISRFGYAHSTDATTFDYKSPYPIFTLDNPRSYGDMRPEVYDRNLYTSGGSWGGCEDPRIVKINDTLYMTFNIFGGWDYMRVAITSIKEQDLLNQKWNWTKVKLLSPVGQIHKNWMLFPEKINGKFAVLHSINPKVEIELIDSFDNTHTGAQLIESPQGPRMNMPPRETWDSWPRSVGAPPLRTRCGWLVFYNVTTKEEKHKYQTGAMLLDVENPTKILARAPAPLISPDEWYENDWKPGIIYTSGALIKGDDVYVYYGGGDKHICSAHMNLETLLTWMLRDGIEK